MNQSIEYGVINTENAINYKDYRIYYLNHVQRDSANDSVENYDNYIKRIIAGDSVASRQQEQAAVVEDNSQKDDEMIPKLVWPDGVIAPQELSDNSINELYDSKYDLPALPPSRSNRRPFGGFYDEHSFDYLKSQICGALQPQNGSQDYKFESMV